MTLVVASAAVLGFALVLARSRLGAVVQRVVRAALDGVTAVLDPDLDDLEKERAARRSDWPGGSVSPWEPLAWWSSART